MQLLLTTVCLTCACINEQIVDAKQPGQELPYLTIYVYSPSNPIATRADANYLLATDAENAIKTLQLWVFKHNGGELVGYTEDKDVTLGSTGKTYKMTVSSQFADSPEQVDVYAVANVAAANAGQTFSQTTTRSELDAAKLSGSHFFGSSKDDLAVEGLPMTGVLKNQEVVGSFPALRIGSLSEMATVQLVRSVSKLQFIFVRGHDATDTEGQLNAITGISIDADVIPQQEFLMLEAPYDKTLNPAAPLGSSRLHIVPSAYEPIGINFDVPVTDSIPIVADPKTWVFDASKTDEYLPFGLTYLRESDRRLSGTISYTVEKDPTNELQVTFEMTDVGDFTRNHSWTILVVFEGGKVRLLQIVDIGVAKWNDGGGENHDVYNW